jgi:site-specific recombinase XerD
MQELVEVSVSVRRALVDLAVLSLPSARSKAAYRHALDGYLVWYSSWGSGGFTRASVMAYLDHLRDLGKSASSINLALSAIRKLSLECSENGYMDKEAASSIARIRGVKSLGVRSGNWLTLEQAEKLLLAPDPATLMGARDRALLAVLIGCGLRRSEAHVLTLEDIQQREGRWAIVDLKGKGQRVRTVPMPNWTKAAIDDWIARSPDKFEDKREHVFRSIGPRIGNAMSSQAIFCVVKKYAASALGIGNLAPHDLRRTFAKLAHKGRAQLEQIQLSLGHASIQTTERYLGVRQDFTDAPCDRLGIKVEGVDEK